MTVSQPLAPRVLLCSGWQTHNIGDIAHTPGALALLERYLPEAHVTVWEFRPLTEPIRGMIRRRFPNVSFAEGTLEADGSTTHPKLAAAVDAADFALHASGPATLAWDRLAAFHQRTSTLR